MWHIFMTIDIHMILTQNNLHEILLKTLIKNDNLEQIYTFLHNIT